MLVSSLLSCRIARWPWVLSRPVNEARDVLGDLEAIPFSKTIHEKRFSPPLARSLLVRDNFNDLLFTHLSRDRSWNKSI
jgi:hypothetical protein